GTVTFGATNNQIDLTSWQTGTFEILTATNGIDETKFNAVTVDEMALGSRQSANLTAENSNSVLKLTTTSNNLDLIWSGTTDGNWNTTATGNWNSGEKYNANDYVTFTDSGSNKIVAVNGTGVQVAGMKITGGDYTFQAATIGNKITGVIPVTGTQTKTGQLEINTGSINDGTVQFNLATDFINGTKINGGTVVLGHDEAFGVTGTDQRGIVSVNGNVTIKSEEDRTLQNKFTVDSAANLNFQVDAGTTTTFSGSHDHIFETAGNIDLISNGNILFTGTTNAALFNGNASLNILGNGNIFFDTPITSNTVGGNSFTKSGNGIVQFAGNNQLNPSGSNGTNVTVNSGIFRLANNATWKAQGNNSTFNTASGTTLAGQGSIISNNLVIAGMISPDTDYFQPNSTTVADNKKIGTLNLVGNTTFNGTTFITDLDSNGTTSDKTAITGTVTFGATNNQVDLTSWQTGTFEILTATNGIDATKFNAVTLNNSALTGRQFAVLTAPTGNVLNLTTVNQNRSVTWNSGTDWNTTTSNTNWKDGSANEYFMAGDSVTFTNTGAGNIAIDSGGLTVADMTITGGDYTFTGGNIATTSSVIGNSVTPTQKFQLSGGSVTFSNTNNHFAQNIETLTGTSLKLTTGSTLQTDTSATIAGTLAGNGIFKSNNNITLSKNSSVSPGNAYGEIGTLRLDGDTTFDGITFHVDLADNNVSDQITILNNKSLIFGTNKNVINLNNWNTGTFNIVTATISNSITNKFNIELNGQSLKNEDYTLTYNNGVLQLLTRNYIPDDYYEWTEDTDFSGDLSNDNNFPTDVIAHYAGQGVEDVTVDGNVNLTGLVVSNESEYHFHGKTKNDTNSQLIIQSNPDMENQRNNGKLAVINNSNLIIAVPVDAERGTTIQDSSITIANNKSLGTYQQNSTDPSKSAGQTTIYGDVKLGVSGDIATATRTIVTEESKLNINGDNDNAVQFSGVHATDIDGAAFSLQKGSTLSIVGNTTITDNSTTGNGGGIYAEEKSTIALDSSNGGIEIINNTDQNGSNDIVLAENENTITGTGENKNTGTIIGHINAVPGSSGNKLIIDTESFLQTQESVLNTQPGSNHEDNQVAVESGQWRMIDRFDVGGSLVYVAEKGTIAGNGTIKSSDFQILGEITPDNATFTSTSTIVPRNQQRGTIILDGTAVFDGTKINVELIDNSDFDHVVVKNLTFGATKNIINVNSWSNGTDFIVLETEDPMPADTLNHFDVRIGNEEIPTSYTRNLTLTLKQPDNQTLTLNASIPETETKRLRWTGNSNNYLDMASVNNWVDDYNNPVQFAHTDFLEFDATGKQGEIILGTTNNTVGGRTVSGMKITGGNYKFTGGDLFGTKTSTTPANLIIADGNVEFQNHVFFDGNIQLLNGSKTILSNKKAFHAEGDFTLAETAALTIEVGNDIIRGKNVALNGTVTLTNEPIPTTHRPHEFNLITATETPLNTEQLNMIFNNVKGLIKRESGIEQDNSNSVMTLKYNAIPLTTYAAEHHFTKNQNALAVYFEQTFNSWECEDFELELMQLNDTGLNLIFDDLAGAVVHTEAKYLALTNPYRIIARHGNIQHENNTQRYNNIIRSQCSKRTPSTQQFWFTVQHRETEQQGDGNAPQFNISRTGMMLGRDWNMTSELTVGGMFSYGNPKLFQTGNEIKADDYTFGIYAHTKLDSRLILNGFFGYGYQSYQGKRRSLNTLVHSDYDGYSLFSTLELVRKLSVSNNFVLLPTLAADYQQARTENFIETKSNLIQYHFKNNSIDQFVMRFGLNSQWHAAKNFDWETRLQYGRRLDNNKGTKIQTTIAGSSASPMTLYGVNIGRDLLNIGFGSQYHFGKSKGTTIFGHYDFDRWNRSKSHTAELGIFINR
ncbi:MAG: autotransporter domain-containing protein, partial [Planctomycetaceae bacterium]|nr:autotransporter domain-containing protein [Planctomycetaceae bacterium]